MKKITIVALAVCLILAFFALDLNRFLTVDGIKASLGQFEAWRSAAPLLVGFAFFALYVLVAALSVPGAAVMTLAAGALFGLLLGTVIV